MTKEKEVEIKVDKRKAKWMAIGLTIGIILGILVLLWLGGDIGR